MKCSWCGRIKKLLAYVMARFCRCVCIGGVVCVCVCGTGRHGCVSWIRRKWAIQTLATGSTGTSCDKAGCRPEVDSTVPFMVSNQDVLGGAVEFTRILIERRGEKNIYMDYILVFMNCVRECVRRVWSFVNEGRRFIELLQNLGEMKAYTC